MSQTVASSTAPTYVQGDFVPLSTDLSGNLRVSVTSPGSSTGIAPVASTSLESNHVLKASGGSLYSLMCSIGATSGYLMLFDSATLPATGTVSPVWWFPITTGGTNAAVATSWGQVPLKFNNGITAAFSSTGPFTLTPSATAAFSGQVL